MITVIGNVQQPDGTAHVGQVIFWPVSTPLFIGSTAVFTSPITVTTDSSGDFTTPLAAGIYEVDCVLSKVAVNPIRRFRIRVPSNVEGDDEAEVSLGDLVESTLAQADYFGGLPLSGGGAGDTPTATTSIQGKVKIDQTDADPIVMTKKSFTGSNGLGFLIRPVAGKMYIKNSTDSLYYEVVVQTVLGTPVLGINATGIAYASLPTA